MSCQSGENTINAFQAFWNAEALEVEKAASCDKTLLEILGALNKFYG